MMSALKRMRVRNRGTIVNVGSALAYEAMVERTLDELAAHICGHVDLDRLMTLAR